jgi:hypothetical protein
MESQESTPHHPNSPDTSRSDDTSEASAPEPSLEYNGTAGYNSASDTSRDAAYDDLVTGVTAKAQRLTLILALQQREHGITIAELREAKGSLHHGKMSSALTNLHKAGRLARLAERRGRCHVYVLPEFVDERETQAFRPNRPQIDRNELANEIGRHSLYLSLRGPGGYCKCGAPMVQGTSFNQHVADVIVAEFGR